MAELGYLLLFGIGGGVAGLVCGAIFLGWRG